MTNEQKYTCYWCEEEYTEDDMYETGYNHDPMCHECHEIELEKDRRRGFKYVWVGDKRYRD